jgi:NAD(P)-dependent dehydrogenase (short-subunit alcohol dehydrogenase family)
MRVVITGAGQGIGRAIAVRLAAEGATVVVNDLNAAWAQEVADAIGGLAIPGDAASADGVPALIDAAMAHLGDIDVYFANAGIDVVGGIDVDDAEWGRAFEVNVMSQIRAARLLVPRWLERGEGRFVATASAAGLLTMLGGAPYAVTKHGSVAFAEWLAATYGDNGIVAQVLCPQGVRTRMLEAAGPIGQLLMGDAAIEPEDVAQTVWEALHDERMLILPHPEVAKYYAHRAADPDRWVRSMRKLQRMVDAQNT